MKWEIVRVRLGEEKRYLETGYEPFAVVTVDSSYHFENTSLHQREIQRQSTEYIYLKRWINDR